jgi:hypothetical protein
MKRTYRLGFQHPTYGLVATGAVPIAIQDFERIEDGCRPCLIPIHDELPPPETAHQPRAALLVVSVPTGWIPTGIRCLPPTVVSDLSWRTVQSIVMQRNNAAMKSGQLIRRWYVAARRRGRWAVLEIDPGLGWRPLAVQQLPPGAVVMPEVEACMEAKGRNQVELSSGTVRSWAVVIYTSDPTEHRQSMTTPTVADGASPDVEKAPGRAVGILFLPPPNGWTPTMPGARLPNELAHWVPHEIANAMAWRLNWISRRNGMGDRQWRALINGGHAGHKWGILRLGVPKFWCPQNPGLLPPNCIPREAVVGVGESLVAMAHRYNAAQLAAGPVRSWAAVLHAPVDPGQRWQQKENGSRTSAERVACACAAEMVS